MNKIRVGVTGWAATGPADSIPEVLATANMLWVEINGIRLWSAEHSLQTVSVSAGSGYHSTAINLVGLPEFVPCDPDGYELDKKIGVGSAIHDGAS